MWDLAQYFVFSETFGGYILPCRYSNVSCAAMAGSVAAPVADSGSTQTAVLAALSQFAVAQPTGGM